MSKDTGGPAFPGEHFTGAVEIVNGINRYVTEPHQGMTLRDYFAAKALQGMLADSEIRGSADDFAKRSYAMADAMLKAREA